MLNVRGGDGGPRGVGGEDSCHLKCETKGRQDILPCRVQSRKDPFMASLGQGQMDFKARVWVDLGQTFYL